VNRMRPLARIYVFVAVFTVCWLVYFVAPVLYPQSGSIRLLEVFEKPVDNFIFMIAAFLAVSFTVTGLLYVFCCRVRGEKGRGPKLGEVLISQGMITRQQLNEALSMQKLRIGEILVRGGRLTEINRDQALAIQRKKYRRIGEILRELGYSTEADVRWALHTMNQKIGSILREMNLITEYDLTCALYEKDLDI